MAAEPAIHGVMEQLVRAWNAQDWAGFAARFTPDCHYVSAQGKVLSGREQISAFLLSAVTSRRAVTLDDISVRRPVADSAVVLCRWTLQSNDVDGNPTGLPPRQGLFTALLVKTAADWTITSLHNTSIEPDYPKE